MLPKVAQANWQPYVARTCCWPSLPVYLLICKVVCLLICGKKGVSQQGKQQRLHEKEDGEQKTQVMT
jgi:hypothetical protein